MLPHEDDKDPNVLVTIFRKDGRLYSSIKLQVENLGDLCIRLKSLFGSIPADGMVKFTPIKGAMLPVL